MMSLIDYQTSQKGSLEWLSKHLFYSNLTEVWDSTSNMRIPYQQRLLSLVELNKKKHPYYQNMESDGSLFVEFFQNKIYVSLVKELKLRVDNISLADKSKRESSELSFTISNHQESVRVNMKSDLIDDFFILKQSEFEELVWSKELKTHNNQDVFIMKTGTDTYSVVYSPILSEVYHYTEEDYNKILDKVKKIYISKYDYLTKEEKDTLM